MTSQLERKQKGLGLTVFPTEDRSKLKELEEAENKERYIINSCNYDIAKAKAIESFQKGKRVLWVVNTVDRCRQKVVELEKGLGTDKNILTYHSRFTLEHRKQRHKETIAAFQQSKDNKISPQDKEGIIAVTTQVCEMSLDLDADVLITELAPISSLVQRFGRSNRHGLIDYANIWIYEPEKVLPYTKEELTSAQTFLGDIQGTASQRKLAEKLEKHSLKEPYPDGSSSFVDGGYWATSEPFRETDDYLVNAVLDTDIEEFIKLREAKNPDAEGYILPIPKNLAHLNSENHPEKLPKYLAIAPSQFYCKKRGFGK